MTTSIKKPLLSLSLTAGALLAALGLTHHASNSPQSCEVQIDTPHVSTYLMEHMHGPAIKTNVRTICKAQQRNATVSLELFKAGSFRTVSVEKYKPEMLEGTYSPYLLKFQMFYSDCKKSKNSQVYLAKADVTIQLRSGRTERITKESKKSLPLNCIVNLK
jgi:hypothetical protein